MVPTFTARSHGARGPRPRIGFELLGTNLSIGYDPPVTWGEVVRKLKAAGFVEVRSGKGSHRLFRHPATGADIWIAVHTKKDAGQLGNRILREAGLA